MRGIRSYRFVMIEDGFQARHFPYDGPCWIFDGTYFSVFDAVQGDFRAEIGDDVCFMYLDGVGFRHLSWQSFRELV